jgi:hypothetical protein
MVSSEITILLSSIRYTIFKNDLEIFMIKISSPYSFVPSPPHPTPLFLSTLSLHSFAPLMSAPQSTLEDMKCQVNDLSLVVKEYNMECKITNKKCVRPPLKRIIEEKFLDLARVFRSKKNSFSSEHKRMYTWFHGIPYYVYNYFHFVTIEDWLFAIDTDTFKIVSRPLTSKDTWERLTQGKF